VESDNSCVIVPLEVALALRKYNDTLLRGTATNLNARTKWRGLQKLGGVHTSQFWWSFVTRKLGRYLAAQYVRYLLYILYFLLGTLLAKIDCVLNGLSIY